MVTVAQHVSFVIVRLGMVVLCVIHKMSTYCLAIMQGFMLNKTRVYVWHALGITLDSQQRVDMIEHCMFHAGLN